MNSEQRERLIERHRYINVDHDHWHESVYADFREDMKAVGINVWCMHFSGFHSQGDGACFEGAFDNVRTYLDHHHKDQYPMIRKLLEHEGEVYARCEHRGHYYHENCTEFWVDSDTLIGMLPQPTEFHETIAEQWQSELEDEVNAFEKDVIEQWRTYMQDLYRRLKEEHEYYTSDEAVWETLEANGMDEDEEDCDEAT
jgi:hypothetical protein